MGNKSILSNNRHHITEQNRTLLYQPKYNMYTIRVYVKRIKLRHIYRTTGRWPYKGKIYKCACEFERAMTYLTTAMQSEHDPHQFTRIA